ncbi:box C/D snoRNA protein 1 [Aulostomus maculatus]
MSIMGSQVDNSGHEEELRGTKRKISLSSCGVCGSEDAKYRCPACLRYTCSLLCVKKHKEDSRCSGVRSKTAFVMLSEFDEMALLNDYRFLEDTGRFADGANRDDLIRVPRATFKSKKLLSCARKMNITLKLLPITFSKSKENSTIFLSKEKQFLWHLKLIFPQSCTEFSQRRVSDLLTLDQILTPYIHPTESDPVTRQKLKMYVRSPFDHIKVFMKAEGRKANSVRYHKMDIRMSLRDNLRFKALIEFPVLHVVLGENWKDYPLKGPAEPASACNSFAKKSEGADQLMEDLTRGSPSPYPKGGTAIWKETSDTSSECDSPQEKRAKKETVEEELEEGEIIDSGDDLELEGTTEENTPCHERCDDARSQVDHRDVTKDGLGDGIDKVVGGCLCKDAGTIDDNGAARESAEVSMMKEEALKEPGPVS